MSKATLLWLLMANHRAHVKIFERAFSLLGGGLKDCLLWNCHFEFVFKVQMFVRRAFVFLKMDGCIALYEVCT